MLSNETLEKFIEQQQAIIEILGRSNDSLRRNFDEMYDRCERLVQEKVKFIQAIKTVAAKVDKIPIKDCCLYGADIIDMFREEGVW